MWGFLVSNMDRCLRCETNFRRNSHHKSNQSINSQFSCENQFQSNSGYNEAEDVIFSIWQSVFNVSCHWFVVLVNLSTSRTWLALQGCDLTRESSSKSPSFCLQIISNNSDFFFFQASPSADFLLSRNSTDHSLCQPMKDDKAIHTNS